MDDVQYLRANGCPKTADVVDAGSNYPGICRAMIAERGNCADCKREFDTCDRCKRYEVDAFFCREGKYECNGCDCNLIEYEKYFDIEFCVAYLAKVKAYNITNIPDLHSANHWIAQLCHDHLCKLKGIAFCNINSYHISDSALWELRGNGASKLVETYNSGASFVELVRSCSEDRYDITLEDELPIYCDRSFNRDFLTLYNDNKSDKFSSAIENIEDFIYEYLEWLP